MNRSNIIQMCNRCVMDTTAQGIEFDTNGICNYCTELLERSNKVLFKDPDIRNSERIVFIDNIKKRNHNKKYDCIVGVSGGVDSSWALLKVVESGLRPLAVHMDNGWDSELAHNNISNLVNELGVDLYTHVINWNEYKLLMQAFFDADVIDVELLYDNAMLAVNYQQASKNGANFILSGSNQSTEGMKIPENWLWMKYDKKNIKALAHKFSNIRLKTFPSISTLDSIRFEFIKGVHWVPFLDYYEFNKSEALAELEQSYNFKKYPYKHYESIFTRFYQGYILPKKFGVDKRKVHLSSLIISKQLERNAALTTLQEIPYPSKSDLDDDKQYFLKKMGWSPEQLEDYLKRPEIAHNKYPSEKKFRDLLLKLYRDTIK